MKDAAIKYHEAGLKVIPFWDAPDGGKRFPPEYAKYRDAQTREDIEGLFSGPVDGVAILCTDGIEVIDIDVKHDPEKKIDREYFAALKEYVSTETALKECVIQKTKSDGWHIIYRTDKLMTNTKLARLPGNKEAVIETRGKGGIVFVYPSPGYSIKRGDLTAIPTISDRARDRFIQVAKEMDHPEPVHIPERAQKDFDGEKPGEAFNASTDIVQMMEGYGWKVIGRRGDRVLLNRPGAKHSRATDATCHLPTNTFYPFTTSTDFTSENSYSPFAVYAVMQHGGDFHEAARDLYQQGFGDRKDLLPDAPERQAEAEKKEKQGLIQKAMLTRFDYHQPIREEDTILTHHRAGKEYKVAGFGQMGVFTGAEKSGKSFVTSCIAASALLSGFQRLTFRLDLRGKKMLWFDTEQSEFFYKITQRRIHTEGSTPANVDRYTAYHLRRFTPDERLTIIQHFIYETPNVGVVFIDGFVDLVNDYNDLKESQAMVGKLMRWTDEKNVLLMGVLHVNKGDGKIRGHLGSELKNKADFVVKVAQPERNIYEVSNPTCRYPTFPNFTFTRDEETGQAYVEHEQDYNQPANF